MAKKRDKSVWWHNLKVFPQVLLAKYLRKRKWVVFYLEPKHRVCNGERCWLKLYLAELEKVK